MTRLVCWRYGTTMGNRVVACMAHHRLWSPLGRFEAIRVAIGLRLGVTLCRRHTCPCGAKVDETGSHGLSCRYGTGRIARHDAINDIIYRALVKANIPSKKERRGLNRRWQREACGRVHAHTVAARQIHCMGCDDAWHLSTLTFAQWLSAVQWRCRGGRLAQENR